jgi:hypothetical protein
MDFHDTKATIIRWAALFWLVTPWSAAYLSKLGAEGFTHDPRYAWGMFWLVGGLMQFGGVILFDGTVHHVLRVMERQTVVNLQTDEERHIPNLNDLDDNPFDATAANWIDTGRVWLNLGNGHTVPVKLTRPQLTWLANRIRDGKPNLDYNLYRGGPFSREEWERLCHNWAVKNLTERAGKSSRPRIEVQQAILNAAHSPIGLERF